MVAVDLQNVEARDLVGIVLGPFDDRSRVGDAGRGGRAVIVADDLGPIDDQQVRPLEPGQGEHLPDSPQDLGRDPMPARVVGPQDVFGARAVEAVEFRGAVAVGVGKQVLRRVDERVGHIARASQQLVDQQHRHGRADVGLTACRNAFVHQPREAQAGCTHLAAQMQTDRGQPVGAVLGQQVLEAK